MHAGYIADIVVVLLIIVTVLICTKRGFIRSALHYTSPLIALLAAIFTAGPLATWLDHQFGWGAAIAGWNLPLVSASTLLTLLVGVAVFIVSRLAMLLVDRLLRAVKEKIHAVNVIDRWLGCLFGLVVVVVELTGLFMLIDSLGLRSFLQLTPEAGGVFAHQLFTLCQDYVFPVIYSWFSALSSSMPKI